MKKSIVIHLGYHKTGSSSLQKWLLDHAEILEPHLLAFNLADGGSNPLKFETHKLVMGVGSADGIVQQCREIRNAIHASSQPKICITDEGLLGHPLGFSSDGYQETDIYPRAREIVSVIARELAEFHPTFVALERDAESWLRSVHNQMFKQGCVEEAFDEFIERFQPDLSWENLRAELRAGIGDNGKLVVAQFEDEVAKATVAEMALLQELDLPEDVLAQCRQKLEHINASVPLPAPVPRRKAIVLGGSNSMIAGGWVNILRRDFHRLVDITNLSVGACTSAMALYRFLNFEDRAEKIPIIWEYGLNEFNHLQGGQALESLLYHLEWLIQLCIREDRPFLPVLMCSRTQLGLTNDPYKAAILDLFARYGIWVIDCSRLLRVVACGDPNLGRWYSDDAHYDTNLDFPARLAEHVVFALDDILPPIQIPERAQHFDQLSLVLVKPSGTPTLNFNNSVLSCDFVPFEDAVEVPVSGLPLAAFVITSGTGPKITFKCEQTDVGPFSTQVNYGAGIPARQLRQLVFDDPDADMTSGPNSVMRVHIDDSEGDPIIQTMFCWKPASPDSHKNGLVSVLCEVETDLIDEPSTA